MRLARFSRLFIPTLKETPADAVAPTNSSSAPATSVSSAPASTTSSRSRSVLTKIANIVREEMNAIGGQEIACRRCTRPRSGRSRVAGTVMADNMSG